MTVHTDPLDFYLTRAEKVRIIADTQEAIKFLKKLAKAADYAALDFETTGLDPRFGKVRLSCIYHPSCGAVIIDHFLTASFVDMVDHFLPITWIVYNSKFEVNWFDFATKYPKKAVDTVDVDYMAKVKLGGYASSLARMCKRDLKVDLDKTLQTSDWSVLALSRQQYIYGALDGVLTWALFEYWDKELTDAQWDAVDVFNDAVRGTMECEKTGLILDADYHEINIKRWEMKLENAVRCVRRYTPKSVIDNLNSKKQVSDFIKSQLDQESLNAWPETGKRGWLSLERKTTAPIAAKAPYPFSRWLNAYILYSYYSKYLSTYGDSLLHKQRAAGKVQSRFNIAQAGTGRYSSSSSNLQNIPRKIYVRKAFHAPPEWGTVMVLADYSGIEVRVLAELSQDKQLLEDAIYGDVHAGSAATIFGYDEEEFNAVLNDPTDKWYYKFKGMRTKAKGFTFQLTYGAQAAALSLVLKCSVEEAQDAMTKWSQRYPDAFNYRFKMNDEMNNTGFLPVCDGRTIYVRKPDRSIPVASNYPIQGAAASVMYRAVYHTHKNIVEWRSGVDEVALAATVHDELLLYCVKSRGKKTRKSLIRGMEQGWLDIFPNTTVDNLIDSAIGQDWSAKP